MPFYAFKCPICDVEREVLRGVKQVEGAVVCDQCESNMVCVRDVVCAGVPMTGSNRYYNKPLHSDSLAIAKSQVAEHNRRWPGIEIDSEFRPVFTNFKQHDDYLKETGFAKLTQIVRHVATKRYVPKTVDGKVTMYCLNINQ